MRASTDFLVVGTAGIGTALFLTQLLIVGQQIVTAKNHIQAELVAEKGAVTVNWIDGPKRTVTERWGHVRPPHPHPHPLPQPARHYDIANAHIAGHPIFKAAPTYPERAQERGISGYVDFAFTLKQDGSVVDPEVIAEVPAGYGFANAAARVFSRWRFQPDLRTGTSESTVMRYRMSFSLPN